MSTLTFEATGQIQPAGPAMPGTAVVEEVQPVRGTVTFKDTSLTVNGQEIPYSNLKSAVMQIHYGLLGVPFYTLTFTDGDCNFMLHIPRKDAEHLPLSVNVVGRRSWLRRHWVALLFGLNAAAVVINELLSRL